MELIDYSYTQSIFSQLLDVGLGMTPQMLTQFYVVPLLFSMYKHIYLNFYELARA